MKKHLKTHLKTERNNYYVDIIDKCNDNTKPRVSVNPLAAYRSLNMDQSAWRAVLKCDEEHRFKWNLWADTLKRMLFQRSKVLWWQRGHATIQTTGSSGNTRYRPNDFNPSRNKRGFTLQATKASIYSII